MHRSICFSFVLIMVSNHICDTLGDASFKRNPFGISGIQEKAHILSSLVTSLNVNGLWLRMYWRRIAAAAAAAVRGDRGYPYRGSNGFPMHAWRFNLRFSIVRILWALPVIYHGRFGRFGTHIIEVFFLCAHDEFHSQTFRDHDLSKSTRSILKNSVMVLVLQCQEHR